MKILRIAMAFAGVIIGAGFASGQEILQYYTSFGMWGIIGTVVTSLLFSAIGYILLDLGSGFRAQSHNEVFDWLLPIGLSKFLDIFLIVTTFGIGVAMIAGAGTNLSQQFGLPVWAGSLILCLIIIFVGFFDTEKVVSAIGVITPFLIIIVMFISITTLLSNDTPFTQLAPIAEALPTTLPNWVVSSGNYVAFNVATGASMAMVTGGSEPNKRTAKIGGLVGGLVIGLLIIIMNLTLLSKIETVGTSEMPMLALANEINPTVGVIMALLLFCMIWNTGMGVIYPFVSRFATSGTRRFNVVLIATVIAGYLASFAGFTTLIAYLYPLIGYFGFVLIGALVYGHLKTNAGPDKLPTRRN